MKIVEISLKYCIWGKCSGLEPELEPEPKIFDKLVPELHKNRPAPQQYRKCDASQMLSGNQCEKKSLVNQNYKLPKQFHCKCLYCVRAVWEGNN
jgi:hypothetical protein